MTKEIRVYGLPEASLRERLAGLLEMPFVAVTLLYNEGHGTVVLTGEEAALAAATAHVAECLGSYVYSYEGESLATCVVNRLATLQLTVATAESCTGGRIASRMTGLAGVSSVYRGGVVSYWTSVKGDVLGVPQEILDKYGPVSEQTARAMAEGACRVTGAEIAVSVTGSAGPDPDERGTPVGIVYIGLATPTGTFCRSLDLGKRRRDRIQDLATNHAFDVVRRYLSGLPVETVTRRTSHP